MSLQGPILIVGGRSGDGLVQAFAGQGAFPVIEASWAEARRAVDEIKPSAIVASDPADADSKPALALSRRIAGVVPFIPLIVRLRADEPLALPDALPIAADAPVERLVARVSSALRVRALHAAVLGRAHTLKAERNIIAELPAGDPLDEATVLVVGRGRNHPTLSVAVGERMAVMGALSIESAASCLKAREIDGIVIGDGLPSVSVDAFLSVLAEDARFRELPVGALRVCDGIAPLPNLVCARDPLVLLAHMMPLVRLRAFEGALKRLLYSIECKGMIDPRTGLLNVDAFGKELDRAIADVGERGVGLSLARFSFEPEIDRRTGLDAARLVSRLVRDIDFACQQEDGSILFVFAEADLKAAHVAARRLASVLKHAMLQPGGDRPPVSPAVTLATLKPADTMLTLLARVAPRPVAAA
jgi:hypothetical protein